MKDIVSKYLDGTITAEEAMSKIVQLDNQKCSMDGCSETRHEDSVRGYCEVHHKRILK